MVGLLDSTGSGAVMASILLFSTGQTGEIPCRGLWSRSTALLTRFANPCPANIMSNSLGCTSVRFCLALALARLIFAPKSPTQLVKLVGRGVGGCHDKRSLSMEVRLSSDT